MKYNLLAFLLLISFTSFAQNFNMANDSVAINCATGGTLFDNGGSGGNYTAGQNLIITICTNGDPLGLEFVSATFGTPGDFLAIYDGSSISGGAPLLDQYSTSNTPLPGTTLRATVNNPSGCLTFQFYSEALSVGGNFEIDLLCQPACKSIEAEIANTIPGFAPNDTVYINSCPGDTVQFFGNGIYDSNTTGYTQNNSLTQFYWDFGDGSQDTTQNPLHVFPPGQIYSVSLMIEDTAGCRSRNEIDLRVRQAPDRIIVFDPGYCLVCLGDTIEVTALLDNNLLIGDSNFLDTITGQSAASVRDTVFLPDDSDGSSGNGITSPVIYPLEIYGYIPGTTVSGASDIIEVCLEIEHSFVGDLDIRVVCPNGQFTQLIDFSPPGTPGNNLGIPGTATVPGTTFEYCWSPTSTAGTIDVGQPPLNNDPVTAGTYQAVGSWNSLIGCPFNGTWSVQVFDDYGGDDGWCTAGSIELNPQYLLDPDTFLVFYENPLWTYNSVITTNLNDTTILAYADDTIPDMLYFNVQNNMGCVFTDSIQIFPDFFTIVGSPEDTSICGSSNPVQLNASIEGVPLVCTPDYTVSSIPIAALPANSPTSLTLGDDVVSSSINIGFPFEFFCNSGASYNSFKVSSNGFISFNSATGAGCCSGQNLPNTTTPNDLIALFWTDLNQSNGGQIRHWTSGTAPNRVRVVEFNAVPHFGSTQTVTGQIHLKENGNIIEIHCVNCQSDGGVITVGIENSAGTVGYAAPGYNASASAAVNQAWRFSPVNSLGSYAFNWSPSPPLNNAAIQNPIATVNSPTEFIVDVTNVNGCTFSDTIFINAGGNFQSAISNDTALCGGQSVQLQVTGGAQAIAWTPNNGSISDTSIFNPIFTPDTTTTYFALLDSAGGCTKTEHVTIYVSQFQVDSTILVNETCAGDANGSITIFASGAIGSTEYSIDNGVNFVTSNAFTNLSPGFYDIVVRDSISCDTLYQVEITGNLPMVFDSIVITNLSCFNNNTGAISLYVSSGVSPYNYSIDAGTTSQTTNMFSNLSAGMYTVWAEDSLGCSVDSAIVITEPALLELQLVNYDSVSCNGLSDGLIEISASGGTTPYSYTINNGAPQATGLFNSLMADTFTLVLTDGNLCTDTLTEIVYQPDSLALSGTADSVSCFGLSDGTISLTANGGTLAYQYSITDDAGLQLVDSFNNLPSGNYTAYVIDNNACRDSVNLDIFEPALLTIALDSAENATCGLNNGAIYVSAQGGTLNYSFTLNSGTAQPSGLFNNLTAGNYTVSVTDQNGCDTSLTYTLNGYPAAQIGLVTIDSVSCFGLSDGSIEVEALDGTSPFMFTLNGGAAQSSGLFSGLNAGTYTLVVADSINCTDTLTAIVNQPNELILNAQADSISCYGLSDGTLTLTAQGGNPSYQFSISNDAGLQNSDVFNSLSANTYISYVVDVNNCRDTVSINVFEPDSFYITSVIANDINCFGDGDGSFIVNATGGTLAYSYSLDNVMFQSSNVLSGLNGGIYTIYAQDANGCADSKQDSIFEPTTLVLSLDTSINITCNSGSDGQIIVSASGATPNYSFSLNNGTTTQTSGTFQNLNAGAYTIWVSDANGCTQTLNVILTQPNPLVVVIDSTNILCSGYETGVVTITSISGETAPYSVTFNGGTPQAYTTGMSFTNLAAGAYTVEINDVNNCPNPAYLRTINIEVPSPFFIDTVITNNPDCFGYTDGSIQIFTNGGGVAPYQYFIYNSADTINNATGLFTNLGDGDYAVWIVDANGCTDQAIDSLVQPDELILLIDTVINPSCFGYEDGAIWVSAYGGTPDSTQPNPYSYALADGTPALANTFINLEENTYQVIVTDAAGCTDDMMVTLEDPLPVLAEILPQDTLIDMGDTFHLAVLPQNALGTQFTYVWSPETGLSCTDCSNPTVQLYNDQEYTLTFADGNGCFTTVNVTVYVNDTLYYFIPNAFTPGGFDNFNENFEVYGKDVKYVDMMIYNRWGEKLYETSSSMQGWDGTYQGVLQNPGVYTYFIRITFLNDAVKEHKGSVTLLR